MRKHQEIVDQVVAEDGGAHSYPSRSKHVTHYLTHKGQLVDSSTDPETLKGRPGVVEKVTDEDAFKAAELAYRNQQRRINDLWKAELRAEYMDLNDETFEVVYAAAYERGHSTGMDEVAELMEDVHEFAMKLIRASKAADA